MAVTAQAVATIGLTLTAVINIPEAMRSSGRATWISYLLALLLVLLVGETLVLFRRLPGQPSGIAGYVEAGLGFRPGAVASWGLLLGYGAAMLACLAFLGFYLEGLLGHLGLHVPQMVGYLLGAVACLELARRDVQLSTRTMLITESISVLIVVALSVLVLLHGWGTPDLRALDPRGDTPAQVGGGLMVAVLSFIGFESAANLGSEAVQPERSVPRGIRISLLFAGLLFVFWAVFLPEGISWLPAAQQQGLDPVSALADRLGNPGAGLWIKAGGLLCLFGSSLGSLTALSRVGFSLAQDRLLPRRLGRLHPRYGTPDRALLAAALPLIAVGALTLHKGLTPSEIFSLFGGFAVLGFLLVYGMVALASLRVVLPGSSSRRRLLVGGTCLLAVIGIAVANLASIVGHQNGMLLSFVLLLLIGVLRACTLRPTGLR